MTDIQGKELTIDERVDALIDLAERCRGDYSTGEVSYQLRELAPADHNRDMHFAQLVHIVRRRQEVEAGQHDDVILDDEVTREQWVQRLCARIDDVLDLFLLVGAR